MHSGRATKRMWIKICGITELGDALAVARCGASAIGLNFFEHSRRFISVERAVLIAAAVRSLEIDLPLDVVGVFVNAAVSDVVQVARRVSLTAVQFHGDESVSQLSEFHRLMPEIRIIRAVRVSVERIEECLQDLDRILHEVPLAACLLDAYVPGEFGGTGTTVDLRIAEQYLAVQRPRLILAGGLTPENVGDVILSARPWGVDTASGVESAPGRKHPEKVHAFAEAANLAESTAETDAHPARLPRGDTRL